MNRIQEAISKVTGMDTELNNLSAALEQADSTNALLQRQIEDLDYLNLFDLHHLTEVIPLGDRKNYYNRLRRLRQENPLAKQAVKLILRFTLGKGVEISIGPDPEKELEKASDVNLPPDESNGTGPKLNGLYPGTKPSPNLRPLARKRPQVGEQEETDDEDQLKEIVEDFWKDPENQKAFTSPEAMKEWLDNNITDGETFMAAFTSEASPYVKLTCVPVEEIDLIVYSPDNWMVPVYYRRVYQPMKYEVRAGNPGMYVPDGQPVTKYYLDSDITEEQLNNLRGKIIIPASQLVGDDVRMFHFMINPIRTRKGKRGVSDLYASREWFRVYKDFIEDRAAINAAATAVAYKRKIKAGPTGVAQFQGKFGGLEVGYDNPNNTTELRKLTRPVAGSIHDTNPAIDLEWMKTDTGAVNAEKDGQALMSAAGAGMGIFNHYFGEGGDANLATAQSMELPMVKTFEDWQEWTNSSTLRLLKFVITTATDEENGEKQIDRVSGTFPPLISQDVVKYTTAWSQVAQNIAPGNKVVHREAIRGALSVMSVPNVDALMTQIEAEEKALEIQREQQRKEMLDAMANQPNPIMDGNGNPGDPNLRRIASGKPEPERNGPKPVARGA